MSSSPARLSSRDINGCSFFPGDFFFFFYPCMKLFIISCVLFMYSSYSIRAPCYSVYLFCCLFPLYEVIRYSLCDIHVFILFNTHHSVTSPHYFVCYVYLLIHLHIISFPLIPFPFGPLSSDSVDFFAFIAVCVSLSLLKIA